MNIGSIATLFILITGPSFGYSQTLTTQLQEAGEVQQYRDIFESIPLDVLSVEIETADENGDAPLMAAAKSLNFSLFDLLIKYGADPNVRDANGRDVLNIAVRLGSPELAERALAAGTDPSAFTLRLRGSTLIFASERGQAEIVKMLIDAGAPLDRVNSRGWTALLEVAIFGNGGPTYQRIVHHLLDAGADPSIADKDGISPHDHAMRRGQREMASIFASRQ